MSASQDKWYDETYFCSQFVDKTDAFPVIGGCKYDYALGQCMNTDVDASVSIRGCAAELEAHINLKVRFPGEDPHPVHPPHTKRVAWIMMRNEHNRMMHVKPADGMEWKTIMNGVEVIERHRQVVLIAKP